MRDSSPDGGILGGKAAPGYGLLFALSILVASCSRQALVVVAACPDGGGGFSSCARDGSAEGGVVGDGGDASDGTTDAAVSLRTGLVGLWHLDDMTGTTALDASGLVMPNNGTLKDLDMSTAWVPGQIGGALETKAAGYVLVPRSASIDAIQGQVTLAAWVYLQGTINDYATAISRQIGSGLTQHYHLSLDSEGRPAAFINRSVPNDFYRPLTADDPVPPMTWTHLAVTYDGSNARLYVDGALADTKPITGSFGDDTTPLILGGNGNEGIISERFPGRIDEIVLYNRALTDAEVRALASGAVF
jgi:hypothetical protein